jgi:hypothetical protein
MSGNRKLIQVVPRLLPARCGVSDHALALASELKGSYGIDSAFIVLNSDERCDVTYPVLYRSPDQLLGDCVSLSGNRSAAILVHLSGYGYSADGAPALLAGALENLKADGRFQIAVFFHELDLRVLVRAATKRCISKDRRSLRSARHQCARFCRLAGKANRRTKWPTQPECSTACMAGAVFAGVFPGWRTRATRTADAP